MTIENELTALLSARADRPVDADALLAATLAAGRARTRRRHGAYALSSAGVAGVVAATLVFNGGPAPLADNPPVGWDTMPALPAVAGADGAAARPDLVGTDPTVLRFGVPWTPFPVQSVIWSAEADVERISIQMSSGNSQISGNVELRRGEGDSGLGNADVPDRTSSVTVDGQPAVLTEERFDWGPNRWVTWHPAPGLTAEVGLVASGLLTVGEEGVTAPPELSSVVDVADLMAFADAVRLDTTTACTAPLRIPEGEPLRGCSGSVDMTGPNQRHRYGILRIATETRPLTVEYTSPIPEATMSPPHTPDPSDFSGTPDAAPTSPFATPTGGPVRSDVKLASIARTLPGLRVSINYAVGDAAEASAVLTAITPAGDPDDPATWPPRPVG
ncbi:hypothetical protein [Asanoa iriomotensis]|uniref:DUF4179 domain-containing protein n=1 Tax=Asanoa iriomotensis TaxID=234613 RepID=A0ABQ4BYP6_9ACTN|nr:hypothetical protein [Asanoa iriomotensis]GIF55605.1 hypothetical protein Air01nite_17000 [Asanoa iriomotensis]